jgi:hypothetical protein
VPCNRVGWANVLYNSNFEILFDKFGFSALFKSPNTCKDVFLEKIGQVCSFVMWVLCHHSTIHLQAVDREDLQVGCGGYL